MPTLKDLAQRIHDETDIADIIGSYVELHQRGARHTGLCPFHDDHKPSLSVDSSKGFYHCFVCKAGGDVITFVREIEGLEFTGALEFLANRLGIPFEMYRGVSREVAETAKKREDTLRDACQVARDFFRHTLAQGDKGIDARKYVEKREIAPEIAEKFELGYAPSEWDSLLGALREKGFRPQTAREAGLAVHHEQRNSFYDRFRGRVIFPIWDSLGRPLAFGGRIIAPADENSPKYINSPETPIYNKGSILYAFHLAKGAIKERKRVVLCEGYMDVVAVHGAGVTEAVASLGTALTEAQAKLIRRHAGEVVFLYDADAAGQEATRRGCEILRKQGLLVNIAPLEKGLDPDDLVRRDGPKALQELVDSAQPALLYLTRQLLSSEEAPKDQLQRRIWVLNQVGPALRANPNDISRDEEIRQVAQWVGIEEDLVRKHLSKSGTRPAQELHREFQHRKLDRPPVAEQALVRCLLEQPELAARAQEQTDLDELITDPRIRGWIRRFFEAESLPPTDENFALNAAQWLADGQSEDEVLLREILMSEEDFSQPGQTLDYTLERLAREAAQKRLARSCHVFAEADDDQITERAARDVHEMGSRVYPGSQNPMRPPRD